MTDFLALFGRGPTVVASAPGRVNLMGEHTDYNEGLVLPTTIPQRTVVELAPRRDDLVLAASVGVSPPATVETYRLGTERAGRGWLDYVQGVTLALRGAGARFSGFEVRLTSRVPIGSGLSSSAALEIALLRALRDAFTLGLDDVALARLGQRAETDLVGARIGIMDQMAVSLCPAGRALLLDTRTLSARLIPLPPAVGLVVIHSGVAHDHARGDYNRRRAECEQAAALLGVAALGHLDERDLARVAVLPDPLARRARHVITEDARVRAAVRALEAADGPRLGRLFAASHASQRDDFEVSVPAVDRLVEIASAAAGAWGARLTGGGFGGAVVIAAPAESAIPVAAQITSAYAEASGHRATVVVPESPEKA